MIDVSRFLEIQPAPAAVLARAADPAWGERPRFLVRQAHGVIPHDPASRSGGDRPGGEGGEWQPVTWAEFARSIRGLATYLGRAAGLRPGDRAAILAQNSVEWAVAAMAIQAAGGVMVPIYPSCTADQIAYVADHSDAVVLFVGGEVPAARWAEVRARCSGVSQVVALDAAAESPVRLPFAEAVARGAALDRAEPGWVEQALAAVALDRPGLMLYTSGTSGNPKGVPLTHLNVGTNARDWLESNAPLLPEEGEGVDLLWLPMSHIFGLGELCLGNTLGFTTYMATPADVLELLPEVAPNVFMSVPAYWDKLARAAAAQAGADPAARRQALTAATGGRLRFCLSGGAGLKREVKDLFHDAGVLLIEGYGLTETSPTLTLNRPDRFRFDSVGVPLPSVELRLADDGEIEARGPSVFAGYHKDPAATEAAFTEGGWFRTGDIGRFTDDGFLQIIDRKKDILVTAGGKNVPPLNIELRFADDPLFHHVVVYGDGKHYLVAGVWVNRAAAAMTLGAGHTEEALRALVESRIEAVNREVARCETIKRFCLIDQPLTVEDGLLTSSLKLRRKAVYARFERELEALYA